MFYTIQKQKEVIKAAIRAAGMELTHTEEKNLNLSLASTGEYNVPDDEIRYHEEQMEYAAVSYLLGLRKSLRGFIKAKAGYKDPTIW